VNLLDRLYRADKHRKTRFHDQKGNRLDAVGLLYTPRVFLEAVLRSVMDYRTTQPWISYRAAELIARMLNKQSRVIEFGSGMSTLWFAERSGSVVSIESDPFWLNKVEALLQQRGITNVDLRLRAPEEIADVDGIPDSTFDFVLVDGPSREACVVAALPKLRGGGSLYLDNTDDPATAPAEAELLGAVQQRGGEARYFTDYVPGQMTPVQGLLARL